MLGLKGLVLTFLKRYDLVCKSVGIWDGIVNPIYGCRVKIAPDINPMYAGFERSCPRDSKNVYYVDVGLVYTCLDLIESYGWWGGWVYSLKT